MALTATALVLSGAPARAASAPAQWYAAPLGLSTAWKVSKGAGVVVADIGPGVDPDQADVRGALVPGVDLSGADYATATGPDPLADTADLNPGYDGTQVAAVLAGRGKLNTGVAGVAPKALIMPIRIGSESPFPNSGPERIAAGIDYAVAHHAQVVLVPAGWAGTASAVLSAAAARAEAAGVVLVAGVGNNGTQGDVVTFPSALPGVLGVGGVGQGDVEWAASTAGPQVAVAAPGRPLRVPAKAGGYTTAYSTHESAGIAAGEAALLRAAHPDWTAGQIVRVVLDTASGDGTRIDDHVGYGLIDPGKALKARAPAETANPLGVVPLPAATPTARASASTGTVTAGLGTPAGTAHAQSGGSNGALPVALGGALAAAVLVTAGAAWFLIKRRHRGNYFTEPAYAPPAPIAVAIPNPGSADAYPTAASPKALPQIGPGQAYRPPQALAGPDLAQQPEWPGRDGQFGYTPPLSPDEAPTQEFRRPDGWDA